MKKLSILVTGVGGDIGQSILNIMEDISSSYDVKCVGVDMDPFAAGQRKCNEFFAVPRASSEKEYIDKIGEILSARKVDYIIPTTEPEIELYSKFRSRFESEGSKVLINSAGIIDVFFDKYMTVEFLRKNDMPYPATFLSEEYDGSLTFPVVIKHRRSYGGKGVILAKDEKELDFYIKKASDLIIQERVGEPSEEYTACVFRRGKDVFAICFRRVLGYGSLTKVAELVQDKEIVSMLNKIADSVDLFGSLNVQFRKTTRGFVPFEINPRFSSTVSIRHHFGFHDVKWWIDACEGKTLRYEAAYRKGVAVKTVGEIFFNME